MSIDLDEKVGEKEHGCGEECYQITAATITSMATGDFLQIAGGKYDDEMPPKNTYYNDIYCGVGLGDFHTSFMGKDMVVVDKPGPVTIRSLYLTSGSVVCPGTHNILSGSLQTTRLLLLLTVEQSRWRMPGRRSWVGDLGKVHLILLCYWGP